MSQISSFTELEKYYNIIILLILNQMSVKVNKPSRNFSKRISEHKIKVLLLTFNCR